MNKDNLGLGNIFAGSREPKEPKMGMEGEVMSILRRGIVSREGVRMTILTGRRGSARTHALKEYAEATRQLENDGAIIWHGNTGVWTIGEDHA